MSNSALSPEEIRVAAATHDELGPDYQDAVIASFLDKVGREIDARVDERLGLGWRMRRERPARRGASPFALAVVSMLAGIPLSAIAVAAGPNPAGVPGLLVIWIALAVINIAYVVYSTPRGRG